MFFPNLNTLINVHILIISKKKFILKRMMTLVCDIANSGTNSDLNGVTLFPVYG
jgi:energy-converting hydrogenase Eha subunit H